MHLKRGWFLSKDSSKQEPKLTETEKRIINEVFNSHTFDDENNDVDEAVFFVGSPARIDNLIEFVSSHKPRPVSCGMEFEGLEGSLVYLRVVGAIPWDEDIFDEDGKAVPLSAVYICDNTFEAVGKYVKAFEEAFRCPVRAVFAVQVPDEDMPHVKELGTAPPVPYGAPQDCIAVANLAQQCLRSRVQCHKGDCEEIADKYGADIFFAAPSDTDEEIVALADEPTLFGITSTGSGMRLYIGDMDPGLFQSMYLLDNYMEEEGGNGN